MNIKHKVFYLFRILGILQVNADKVHFKLIYRKLSINVPMVLI